MAMRIWIGIRNGLDFRKRWRGSRDVGLDVHEILRGASPNA
jgi:hypothetical protein